MLKEEREENSVPGGQKVLILRRKDHVVGAIATRDITGDRGSIYSDPSLLLFSHLFPVGQIQLDLGNQLQENLGLENSLLKV